MKKTSTLRAYLALAAAIGGITWSAIFVRWAGIPGTASAFYRVLIAGAVLVPWRLLRGGSRPVRPRAAWVAIAGGVFFALDLALWNSAVLRTQAAVASVLGNNTPFFVGMISWLVFHRRPRASFWIGLALALAGCLMIMGADLRRGGEHAGNLTGDLMALLASVFFAAYLITTERIRPKMDTLTFSTLAIAGSIATLFILCLALGLPLSGYPPRAWLALAGLGIVSQLLAYYALVYALGHLPATITSVGLLAQVPSTALLAMLLLGEPLTPLQIAGGAIVLVGIYVVNRDAV
ncbi:MAG TPA: DMT family transporter [Vicinamibacterales bacterium]|nr:DMT family transporter [Vicinamibacterales bacterium]